MPRPSPVWATLFLTALLDAACASRAPEAIGIDRSLDTGSAGYCRTTTCAPPAGYPTSDGACEPPDWSDSDTCRKAPASNAPLWWRSACVGYDLSAAASKDASYADSSAAAEGAFQAWTNASCPSAGSASRVSIDVRDLGAVSCAKAGYDSNGPNQNLIVFHDDVWPYETRDRAAAHSPKSLTIALTTVTYDPESGEIFDADIELNSADYTFTTTAGDTDPLDGFDLQSVLTHETGHFLGLAHSPLERAVMNASGDSDTGAAKRALALEDVRGICSIYPADGTRAVSSLVASSESVAEGACDPTPRHGFTSACD